MSTQPSDTKARLEEVVSAAVVAQPFLGEAMTFDQLFRYSEPKRVKRSDTVRGPPLDIDSFSDAAYHHFNFKSYPSTTGLRWHGYVKFKQPPHMRKNMPLQHVPCEVDCSCPDFKYRFAWADKQRGAARIGPQSMNKCINRAPRHTNPANIPGLCKHILAVRNYIYGMLAKFPPGTPDTGEKLAQIVKWADKRWADFPGHMAKAKDQEKWFRAVKAAVNAGRGGDTDYIYQLYKEAGGQDIGVPASVPLQNRPATPRPGPPPPPEEPPPLPTPRPSPRRPGPVLPAAGKPSAVPPKQKPLAVPPGERGRNFPPAKPKGTMANITPPGKRGRQMPPRSESLQRFLLALVDRLNGSSDGANNRIESMNQLQEAIKLIEEIEHDEVRPPSEIAGAMADTDMPPSDAPPPSEPPMDDTAVGADTEGNVVLQLLADIRDLLTQLVGGEEGEGELPPPGEEDLALPPGAPGDEEEDGPVDAIPEAPSDEEEEEEDDEYAKPGKSTPSSEPE